MQSLQISQYHLSKQIIIKVDDLSMSLVLINHFKIWSLMFPTHQTTFEAWKHVIYTH